MLRRYRHRRGPYALARQSAVPPGLKSLLMLLIVGLVLWYAGKWFVGLFGDGNEVQRKPVTLQVERGTVNVSIEGGLMQRAEDTVPLYSGDKVTTAENGRALLTFFDGSRMRIDGQTDLTVTESTLGSLSSALGVSIDRGTLWVQTPPMSAFSGSITRTVATPSFTADLTPSGEALIGTQALSVYSSDGQGFTVRAFDTTAVIGEGQRFLLPENTENASDLYAFRSALDPSSFQASLLVDSRNQPATSAQTGTGTVSRGNDTLTITSPQENAAVTTATVRVEGRIGEGVRKVRVNGYQAAINTTNNTFAQELAVTDGPEMEIRVQALDERDLLIGELHRTIRRETAATGMASPAITSPAKTGETYNTQKQELIIRGTSPANAASIIVNNYTLQLFSPEKGTWSYLASVALGNMKPGVNTYDVVAVDSSGRKSEPARITIVVGDGPEGVTATPPQTGTQTSSAPAVVDETTLPKNDPLMPGTLTVTAPTAGASHTATGSEIVIWGATPAQTHSVWVNGYKLQLYVPGKTTWNYIASVEYQNMKRGTNTYRVVARNEKNEILDTVTYTVQY